MAPFSEVWKAGVASSVPCTVRLDKLKEYEGQRPSELAHFTPNLIMGGTLTEKLFDKPSIGNAAVSTMKLQIVDQRGLVTAKAQELELGARMKSPADGITYQARINRTFCVASRRKNRKTGGEDFVLYDRMIFAEAEYEDQVGTYPMPAADVVAFIAQKLGLETDESNEIGVFPVDSPTGVYTMREVLRFIAAGSGGNFTVSADNKLKLVPFGEPAAAEEQACSELDYADDLVITGVRLLPDSETQYFSGTEDGFVVEGECAYATQALCDAVAAKLIGKVYRAFEAKDVRLSPETELGSSIRFGGKDFVLASVNWTIGPAMAATVGAPWAEDEENEIPYQSRDRQTRMTAQSFSEIRKSTEKIALEVSQKTSTEDVNALIKVSTEGITQSFDAKLSGKTGTEDVRNMISSGIKGIKISSETGTAANSASITLSNGDIGFEATGMITMGNVTVDSISASAITTGTLDADFVKIGGQMAIKTAKEGDAVGFVGGFLSGRQGVVVIGNDEGGALTIWPDLTFLRGAALQLICDDSDQSVYLDSDGDTTALWCDNWGVNLGRDGDRWANIYCHNLHDSSDRALKKDITYGLDGYDAFFDALQPCSYRMIHDGDGGKIHTGLIAQDVDAALAAVGLTREEFAGLAMSEKEGASGLVYNRFIALLIDQVQKLKRRVDELEKRNAE